MSHVSGRTGASVVGVDRFVSLRRPPEIASSQGPRSSRTHKLALFQNGTAIDLGPSPQRSTCHTFQGSPVPVPLGSIDPLASAVR
jgi:hypothetical protein